MEIINSQEMSDKVFKEIVEIFDRLSDDFTAITAVLADIRQNTDCIQSVESSLHILTYLLEIKSIQTNIVNSLLDAITAIGYTRKDIIEILLSRE